ncbi:MAG: glycosyltransferase N-terminal domain-containing protein [Elusimicrobiota bacterium]
MMLLLYQLLYPLVAAIVLLKLALAGRGTALREGKPELAQRLGRLSPEERSRLGDRPVWLHAASVGEVVGFAPLVARLAKEPGRPRILFTTSTVAGRERAKALPGVDLAVLAPVDCWPAVRAFLDSARPRCLLVAETELWPMTLLLARRMGVRIGLANGRVTQRAFGRYGCIRGLLAPALAGFERAAVQTGEDLERLSSLGMPRGALLRTGSMKYDTPLPSEEALREARSRLAELGWGEDPCWVAGSTRPGEEEPLLEAQRLCRQNQPRLRLILAPRHVERVEELAALLRSKGIKLVRWTQLLPFDKEPECLLVDRMGVLASLYPCGRAAFVGGTLVPVGGHNLLEPASLGVPVLFGPHTSSVEDVARALQASGGGLQAADGAALASQLTKMLDDEHRRRASEAALATARTFSGATERTWEHIKPLLG